MRKILTSLSLIGMMLMATAWFASYWHPRWSSDDRRTHVRTEGGLVILSRTVRPLTEQETLPATRLPGYLNFDRVASFLLPHTGVGRTARWVYLPIWIPFVAFSILPSFSFLIHRRDRKRLATRRCVACGYDLRESPECCSECGSPSDPEKQTRLTKEPTRLLAAARIWLLLLAVLSVPCVVLSNLHLVFPHQDNPHSFGLKSGEILVAKKDGALGTVQLLDIPSQTPRFRTAYWANSATVATHPPDVVKEGTLAEPDSTSIPIGPWVFEWSLSDWIYRPDSSFVIELVSADTIEELRDAIPDGQ